MTDMFEYFARCTHDGSKILQFLQSRELLVRRNLLGSLAAKGPLTSFFSFPFPAFLPAFSLTYNPSDRSASQLNDATVRSLDSDPDPS
jgi:hypothetical protein